VDGFQQTEDSMPEKLLLTPEEAFQVLSVGRAKGFQMISSGELPSIKVGRLRRVPIDQLRAWVEKRTQEQTAGQEDEGLQK
jgi:excisionase family DNA binding protein